MNIKQTIRTLFVGCLLLLAPVVAVASSNTLVQAQTCGRAETAIITCDADSEAGEIENNAIWVILIMVINILTAGVGVLALAGIVWGAILYTSSGGNPEQVKKAKTVFMNVVIGVVAFAGMFALLNFIVPGGVFN